MVRMTLVLNGTDVEVDSTDVVYQSERKINLDQGHPTSRLSQKPPREISRHLLMFKDCLKRCFYHLEEFDLFGYLSSNLKCSPKILENNIFISEIASYTTPS